MGDSPSAFEIQSLAVPIFWDDYFTTDNEAFGTITSEELLARIFSLGANDIRLIPSYGMLDDYSGNVFHPFLTQDIDSLKTFTDAAQSAGIAITWNPITHFGVVAGDPNSVSHIDPTDPALWFANWSVQVLSHAQIAEDIGAARFQVISDIEQIFFERHPDYADEMIALLGDIREIFSGDLTSNIYTASGMRPFFPLSILRELDLVGLAVTPQLTTDNDAKTAELMEDWHSEAIAARDVIANITRLAEYTGKPIWLSDFSASSYDGANAFVPFKFDATANFIPDQSEQVRYYEAAFREFRFHGNDWFKGISIQSISRVVDPNGNLPPYLESDVGENFYGKAGADTIRDWFTGQVPLDTFTLIGTDYGEMLEGGFAFNHIYAGQANQSLTGNQFDDVFYSSLPGSATAHTLSLSMWGFPDLGIPPGFEVRVNGTPIPIEFIVATDVDGPVQFEIPVFSSGKINSLELRLTNWSIGDGENRTFSPESILLDGQDLLPIVRYFDHFNEEQEYEGFTFHGGYLKFDTSDLNLVANLPVELDANLVLDGREGFDTVIYSGSTSQYTMSMAANGTLTVAKPGGGAGQSVDTISNVELLRFGDGDVLTASLNSVRDWQMLTKSGFAGDIGGTGIIFGTAGFEDITVLDLPGMVVFDPSFNKGGNIVRLIGDASDWKVVQSGSSAVLTDGDTNLQVPGGPAGVALVFDDGVRMLRIDTAEGTFKIGAQSFSEHLVQISASPDATQLPTGANASADAQLLLARDISVTGNGSFYIFGTAGHEIVDLIAGDSIFDPSFNRGGDVLVLHQLATDFVASRTGSSIFLDGPGIDVLIPVGKNGMTISFGDGDERTLRYDTALDGVFVAGQSIGFDPIALAAV